MLYYKHGTLAEERFKNLTDLQWLVHYSEILKMQETENSILDNKFEGIQEMIKATWLAIDPERGKTLIEALKQDTIKGANNVPTKELTPDNFDEGWKELMNVMPHTMQLPTEVRNKTKLVMPGVSRKEFVTGITIDKS